MDTAETNWISVKDRKPISRCKVYAILALMDDGEYRIYHVWPNDFHFPNVRFWQPLPDPPRECDPFEAWWQALPVVSPDALTGKAACRRVWDAAIASAKGQP